MPVGDPLNRPAATGRRSGRKRALTAVAGAVAAAVVLAWVLADRRVEFLGALGAAPVWVLLVATLLQVVALVSRTEAWHVCVSAAGGRLGRRRLYRAASVVALAAASGVLLTATGTAGALAYAAWAMTGRLWTLRPAARAPLAPETTTVVATP